MVVYYKIFYFFYYLSVMECSGIKIAFIVLLHVIPPKDHRTDGKVYRVMEKGPTKILKFINSMLILAASALLVFGLRGVSSAFHSGGVAECEGCHSMHNSLGGVAVISGRTVSVANSGLLKGQDQSSTCLACHASADTIPEGYHILTLPFSRTTLPVEMTPGGDFTWLAKDFIWIPGSGGTIGYSFGYQHGHNVIADDFGLTQDGRLSVAPGGTYSAAQLSCISCHDPHGKTRIMNTAGTQSTTGKPIRTSGSYGEEPNSWSAVGTYRLLGGVGYRPRSNPASPAFTQPAMFAAVNSNYNRTENVSNTRVAYGSYSSEWCANCHNAMLREHGNLPNGFGHPVGRTLDSGIAATYNAYVKTGDMTGSSATSYSSLVPFQNGSLARNSALFTFTSSTTGPSSTDRVTCFTCHRAHASGWNSILRWNNASGFLTVADSGGAAIYPDWTTNPAQAMGRTTQEIQRSYYERPATKFAPYQRTLCNKCHAND
jgi:hypothetical protein